MDFLEELQNIAKKLDELFDLADALYTEFSEEQGDLSCMVENLACLEHDILNARTFANDIVPDMKDICDDWEGTWDEDDTIKGEAIMNDTDEYNPDEDLILEDPSLDNFHLGEWGTTFPDMSEED